MNWMIESMRAQEATAKKFEKISINNVVVKSFKDDFFEIRLTKEIMSNFVLNDDLIYTFMAEKLPLWKLNEMVDNGECLRLSSTMMAIFLGYCASGVDDMIKEYNESLIKNADDDIVYEYNESLVKSVEVEEVENTIDEEE